MKHQIAIFASGNGTNAENLICHFKKTELAQVALVLTNNPQAGVILRAKNNGVPVCVFTKNDLQNTQKIEKLLKKHHINWIVLAGFLLLFPKKIIEQYPKKIINIHPALLPKFGGKGMYGMHIHNAVVANNETQTGITIHFVNENYDEGAIVFQKAILLTKTDTPQDVAQKIQQLEQTYFPQVIEKLLQEN